MIALAAQQQWHMTSVDVRTAFLYGELDEELFMEQPEGFAVKGQEHKVFRLKRTLYGLKQAALQWWKALDKSMERLGFRRTKSDSGIFVLTSSKGPSVIIIVYVDDAIFMGPDHRLVMSKKALFMKEWECRDLGDTKEFLRMNIHRHGHLITLEQKDYLRKVLERFGMYNAKAAPTPLPQGYVPVPNESPENPKRKSHYQQVIGSLLYLMLGTHPDIAFAVTKMSQFAANPSEKHLSKALYICRYLVGTTDYSLTYGKSRDGIIAYADADWGSVHSRRSNTGFIVLISGTAVSWQSKAQKTIALSSTEAEYMVLSDTCCQLVWIHNLFGELHINLQSIPLCRDNQGSIFIASNAVQEKRTKHIDICYHYIREVVESSKVKLYFVETAENYADIFTKNLSRDKYLKCRSTLGISFEQNT